MVIDKERIRQLIPHAGSMCLIDAVLAWDEESIECLSRTHHDPTHPLLRNGRVAAVHAFEYGAQAAAIHGGLVARRAGLPPIAAWLGALHDARLAVDHLDPIDDPLAIGAALLLRDGGNAIYRCRVVANGRTLADGRITIMGRAMAVR